MSRVRTICVFSGSYGGGSFHINGMGRSRKLSVGSMKKMAGREEYNLCDYVNIDLSLYISLFCRRLVMAHNNGEEIK